MNKSFQKEFYEKIRPELKKELSYSSIFEVSEIKKIVLNMRVNSAVTDKSHIIDAINELGKISGQKPIATIAKKSVAGFKIRDGMKIGVKVTLRRKKMYDFIYRLVNIIFPRIRDFRGLKEKAFDGQGNYTIGIREQIIFPEVDYDKVRVNKGINVTFVINSSKKEKSLKLLKKLGFPIKINNKKQK